LAATHEPKFKIDVDELRARGLEHCTHHPNIVTSQRQPTEPSDMPKQYYETVARIKKPAIRRQELVEAEEKKRLEAGARLERLRKMPVQPPSCLVRPPVKKREPLFRVDVTVFPGK
jgi:hypothetical protein